MKKLILTAATLVGLLLSSPAMAGRTDAERDAKEAAEIAKRCDKALAGYLENGTGYAQVVFWCSL